MKLLTKTVWLGFLFIPSLALPMLSQIANADEFKYFAIQAKPAGYRERGELKGYYVEILKHVGRALEGKDVRVRLAPYPRILKELNDNQASIVITCLFPSSLFANHVYQKALISEFDTGVISLAQTPFSWDSTEQQKIAILKSAQKVYGNKLVSLVDEQKVTLFPINEYKHGISLLGAGRVDAFAGNLSLMVTQAMDANLNIAEPAFIDSKPSKITISIHPNHPDSEALLEKINATVEQLHQSGEIQRIIQRYTSKPTD